MASIADGRIEVDWQGLGDERRRSRLGKNLEAVGRRLDAADIPLLKRLGKDIAYALGVARHHFRGKRDAKRKSVFLNLKHGTDELQTIEERNPELAAPRIAYDRKRKVGAISVDLRGNGTRRWKPQHFALRTERVALCKRKSGTNAGKTAGACPHYYALDAGEVKPFDPVAIPSFSRRPLYIQNLHP